MLLCIRPSVLRSYFLLLLCLSLGGLRWQTSQQVSELDKLLQKQNHIQQEAIFHIRQMLSRESNLYEVHLEQLAESKMRESLLLFSENELTPGSTYSAVLEIIPGKKDKVLDTYPTRPISNIRGDAKELTSAKRLFSIANWRVRILAALDSRLGKGAPFAKALLFSDTDAKGDYKDQLRRSGMTHLIVVSGLHIWFIYGMCMILLNALLPRRTAELVFLILITFYAALNFWSPSVLRSVLMIGLFIVARWRSIPLGGAQMLALSLLIITVVSPEQLFDIGLQLSYLCIGVIMLALPRIVWIKENSLPSDIFRIKLNALFDLLLMNVAVGFAILPITLFYFGTASLNGIIGNLLGIPLTGALLGLGFIVLLLPGGNLFNAAFAASYSFVLQVFEKWMESVARLPLYLENTWLSPMQLIGSILVVLVILYMLKQLKFSPKYLPVAGLGIALLFLSAIWVKEGRGIYVFDSGTADCILVRLDDGKNIMVDTGPFYHNATRSWAARKLLPWLSKKNIKEIDWLVLSHLDSDHSGGLPDIAKTLRIRHIIVSDEVLQDARWSKIRSAGLFKNTTVHCVRDTVSFQLAEARMKFLHPDRSYFSESSNGSSLLFRLDVEGKRYIFAGDADIEAEEHLVENYQQELKANYLKAGHHGSESSNSREFVRAVQPEEVWITASRRNRYDFPHPEAMASFRLYAHSIRSTAEGTIYVPFTQKD